MHTKPDYTLYYDIIAQASDIQALHEILLLAMEKMEESGYQNHFCFAQSQMSIIHEKLDSFMWKLSEFEMMLEHPGG